MSSVRRPLLFAPLLVLVACVSSGVTETQINDNLWEIRAWNGDKCVKETPEAVCKKALMPDIESDAKLLCGKRAFELSACRRKPGVSGDRYYCSVTCKK